MLARLAPRVVQAEREFNGEAIVPRVARDYLALDRLLTTELDGASRVLVVNRPLDRATEQVRAGAPFRTFWDAIDAGLDDPGTWSRPDGYLQARSAREGALGFDRGTIYGTLEFDRRGAPATGVIRYGEVGFVLDETAVKNNITLTPGDSLDQTAIARQHVAPLHQAHAVLTNAIEGHFGAQARGDGGWLALAASDATRAAQLVRGFTDSSSLVTTSYVEAQWHPLITRGRLTLDDVREIRVSPDWNLRDTGAQVAELEQVARVRGIPLVVTR